MAFNYGNSDLLRLAEVIFTQRMIHMTPRAKEADTEKLIEETVFLSFEAAEAFAGVAEGWMDETNKKT